MNIKRTIDTAKATYDITGLTREEFSRLYSVYRYESARLHHGYSEHDELLKKFREMSDNDTLIV